MTYSKCQKCDRPCTKGAAQCHRCQERERRGRRRDKVGRSPVWIKYQLKQFEKCIN